jgi:hypothetical protein
LTSEFLVFCSDTHFNSTVAPCPEAVPLDDGGTYIRSAAQAWLTTKYLEAWENVQRIAAGRRVVVVIGGDLVEGQHHHTTQLISHNDATQATIALEMLEPVKRAASVIYVLRGTEAHVGPSAMWEEHLSERIDAVRGGGGANSHWHLTLVVGGVRFDMAHHPSTFSRTPWTRAAGAGRLAYWVRSTYLELRWDPPDVVLRGHIHRHGRGYDGDTYAEFCPGWQLNTALGHRLGAGITIEPPGMLVFECSDGAWIPHTQRFYPERESPWKLPSES